MGILKMDKPGTHHSAAVNDHFPNEMSRQIMLCRISLSSLSKITPSHQSWMVPRHKSRHLLGPSTSETWTVPFPANSSYTCLRLTAPSRVWGYCQRRSIFFKKSCKGFLTHCSMLQKCGFVNFVNQADAIRAKEDVWEAILACPTVRRTSESGSPKPLK